METASVSSNGRRRQPVFRIVPIAVAALAALAALGCGPITPIGPPEFQTAVADPDAYTLNEAITPLVLPAATGGSGALTYSLGPEIPPGLAFEALQRTLSGTPTMAGTWPMTYTVRDESGATDKLDFTITVGAFSLIRSVVAEIAAGDAAGVPRFEDVPEPSGGPAVAVTGNDVYVAGGSLFLDVEPEPGATVDTLLIAVGGTSFGYYEIDVPDSSAAQRLVGRVRFDLVPVPSGCLAVSAVDAGGAVGPPTCHPVGNIPVLAGDVQVTVSWDSDADLDLHVADPSGDEVHARSREVASGGELDLVAGGGCSASGIRNEHAAWTGPPPPGVYEVRVTHDASCGAAETNYVVSVYNHGTVSTFPGTFTGDGERFARGTGRVITRFEVAGGAPAPAPADTLASTYRGSGDQVFVLNPAGEALDGTPYTLNLGSASAEVYVIATAGNYHMNPRVERLDPGGAAADGGRAAAQAGHQPHPRPEAAGEQVSPRLKWITEFNNFNDGPPVWDGSADPARSRSVAARPAVAEGDEFEFLDVVDSVFIPATARKVVTDGTTTVAVWVNDWEWCDETPCYGSRVTQEMVDAVAERFLRPGSGNDIHDWITAVFGKPWGPHDNDRLIPSSAGDEIHIVLFDIEFDGPPTGPRIVGYFSTLHTFVRQPPPSRYQFSAERLAFFMDSPFLATASGETWEVTDRRPSTFLSTLAHEFQHLIHFYQKPVLRDAISESWLNEQASEVAEDLIADKLRVDGPRAVAYHDPGAGESGNLRGRLPGYNLYNDIQVTTWDGYLANYSINYAFGAYLARNYGGAALFSDIVQSDRSGVSAVEAAVRGQGHDASFLDLLTNWAAATLLSDNTDAPAPYQYNTGTWSTSYAGRQEYRLGSINLYNYSYAPGRLARPGPYLHPLPVFNDRTQPPHSNMYTPLGRHTGTIRLRVTAESENRITVVVKE